MHSYFFCVLIRRCFRLTSSKYSCYKTQIFYSFRWIEYQFTYYIYPVFFIVFIKQICLISTADFVSLFRIAYFIQTQLGSALKSKSKENAFVSSIWDCILPEYHSRLQVISKMYDLVINIQIIQSSMLKPIRG